MWGYAVLRCPACAAEVGADFQFCHVCGTPLRPPTPGAGPYLASPYGYPPRTVPSRVLWGTRTKRGLAITIISLLVLWIPGATVVGAALLSVGSTLMYWDRHPFPSAHRRTVVASYLFLWIAAALYVVVFVAFLSNAYGAWLERKVLEEILPGIIAFIWLSTIPTEIIVAAIALQIRNLLPPSLRRQVPWAAIALGGLVLLATVLAFLDVAGGVGSEPVRTSSVLAILNRISVLRIVEGPGFAWFAYLYYRARGTIVPKAAPAGAPAPSIQGP